MLIGVAAIGGWYFGFFKNFGKAGNVTPTQLSVTEPKALPKISAPVETSAPPTAVPVPSTSVPQPPAVPAGPKIAANTVYEGTIHANGDSSTNVPLAITVGSDLKSGTMTKSSRRGDVVVKFTGVWDGATST